MNEVAIHILFRLHHSAVTGKPNIERFHTLRNGHVKFSPPPFGVLLASQAMVMCIVLGCSKRSGRDKDVSFYRVPKVITSRGKQEYELTKKRRDGFLAAISRDGLKKTILENDRICSRHFVSGKPAYLHDESNPDWLPSLHLGHSKKADTIKEITERWERRIARSEARRESLEAAQSLLSLAESSHMELRVPTEEDREEKTDMATQTELTLTSIEKIQQELDRSKQVISDLNNPSFRA